MAVDKYLDRIDDLLEEAWNLPLLGGNKRMLDVQKIRDIIDEIRLSIPQEIKDAKAIVADREDIIKDAKAEAEEIVKRAENRARQILSDEEIVKAANAKAVQQISETAQRTKEMERAAIDFSENSLKKSEDALLLALNEIKGTRLALKTQAKKPSAKG